MILRFKGRPYFWIIILGILLLKEGKCQVGGKSKSRGTLTPLAPQETEYIYEYYDEEGTNSDYVPLSGRRVHPPSLPKNNEFSRPPISPPKRLSTQREIVLSSTPKSRGSPITNFNYPLYSSTRVPIASKDEEEEEVEYAYYEEEPEESLEKKKPELETKVSVSISAKTSNSIIKPTTPKPTQSPLSKDEDGGIVISVATTKSVSSTLNSNPTKSPLRPLKNLPDITTPVPRFSNSNGELSSSEFYPMLSNETLVDNKSTRSRFSLPNKSIGNINSSSPQINPFPFDKLDLAQSELLNELLRNLTAPSSTTSTTTTTTAPIPSDEKSISLQKILPKIQFKEIGMEFLPKDFYANVKSQEPLTTTSTSTTTSTTTTTTTTTTQAPVEIKSSNPLDAILSKLKLNDDISALLPPGYTLPKNEPSENSNTLQKNEASENRTGIITTTVKNEIENSSTTTSAPISGLVFPTRPGGLKIIRTTPPPSKAESPPPSKVNIRPSGWPTRKTTEFTGWPTVSTERTTTEPTSTTSTPSPTIPSSTTPKVEKTTTTIAPPKRSPSTTCEGSLCKMEATLRIVSGVGWRAEYGDINTEDWKNLESKVRRELDGAFRSSGLAPFYRSIKIESFSQGSVLVDYFVFLENVDRTISTDQVLSLFHGSLLQGDKEESSGIFDETLKLGRYIIDPRFTDFKVRNIISSEGSGAALQDAFIPQWGIAVIVIGLASLMFFIFFAITVLVNRSKIAKKNSASLTQEMLNQFNKNQTVGGSAIGYGRDSNSHGYETPQQNRRGYSLDEDAWNDQDLEHQFHRIPPRISNSSYGKSSYAIEETKRGDKGYNIYDSWKTEWNGYYYKQQQKKDEFSRGRDGYSGVMEPGRRNLDYETNF